MIPTLSRRHVLMSAGAAALLSGCGEAAQPQATSRKLARQFDAMTSAVLSEFPENATFRGVDTGDREPLRHRLTDRSQAGQAARTAAARERLAELRTLDRSRLPVKDLPAYDTAVESHDQAVAGAEFGYGDVNVLSAINSFVTTPYAVTQLSGNFVNVPDFLNSLHKTEDEGGAEAYLDRAAAYARGLDQETRRLAADAENGVIAPAFVLANIVGQIEDALAKPVAEWGLVTALAGKARDKRIAGDWEARITRVAIDHVGPALQRQLDGLKALQARATADTGAWKLPRGDAYYAWCLRAGTSTARTAEEIHQVGLEEVRRIDSRMDALLRAQGLTQGTPGERVTAMGRDPKFLYPNDDQGRAALLAYVNGLVAAVRPHMKDLFRTLPKASLEIRRVPPEIEAGAPSGSAVDGSLDGTRPAIYYINLKDTAAWPKFTLPTLTYHEALPGHVWQGDFANRLPMIRSLLQFNAYSEGWALYSEQLADEIGMYRDDPWGQIGYLSDQMLRACRLVVDTGLHAKRWTREQSTAFLVRHTGQDEASMQSETDRYCAMPGQACGYMMGRLEINRLRDKAKAAMGRRFDIRDFNDAMVLGGATPLNVLEGVTDRYIAG